MSRKSIKKSARKLDTTDDKRNDRSNRSALDESFFESVTVTLPPPKKQLTIRLDGDILEWLKAQGKGYHTRINAILRAYYEAHKHETAGR